MKYNKLVRDKIPEIIEGEGRKYSTHVADDNEYWNKLRQKLREEVDEFNEGTNYEEELADILEIIYAICDFKGITKEQLELTRKEKQKKRGGFKDRIILETTD